MSKTKPNAAIIGLGFGAEFIPIYQNHPHANMYAICRRNKSELNRIGDMFGVEKRYCDYKDLLEDDVVDFVHIKHFMFQDTLSWRKEAPR